MQILMIHEFTPNMTGVNVDDYDIITYDDGLESQLYYRDIFPNKRKIFFICPHFIEQGHNGPGEKCMTLEDIKMLIEEGFEIGAHSSSHTPLGHMDSLAAQVSYMMHDTETCIKWFKKNLKITPKSFCFPYNDDCKDVYRAVVRKYGFTEFYGKERTPIEKLLRS